MEEISVEEVQLWGEMTRETSAEQNATATREFISFLRTSRICESDEKNSIETNRRTMVYPQPKTDKTDLSVPLRQLYDSRVIDSILMSHKINLPKSEELVNSTNLPCIADVDENEVLRRAVALLAAHHGFDGSDAEALQTLTDVGKDALGRVCRLLKLQMDAMPDHPIKSLKKALSVVGVSHLDELGDYYRSRVAGKHEKLKSSAGIGSPRKKQQHHSP